MTLRKFALDGRMSGLCRGFRVEWVAGYLGVNRVLIGKLTVAQLLKRLPFYATCRFIVVFMKLTTDHYFKPVDSTLQSPTLYTSEMLLNIIVQFILRCFK